MDYELIKFLSKEQQKEVQDKIFNILMEQLPKVEVDLGFIIKNEIEGILDWAVKEMDFAELRETLEAKMTKQILDQLK